MAEMTWRKLRPGDWIVCPCTGLPEQVTSARRYTAGKWFVRTTRHDHFRKVNEVVTLADGLGRECDG